MKGGPSDPIPMIPGTFDSVWSTISVCAANPHYVGQRDNEVRTTRYRWWSFVPLTLLEQYRVLTNVYFLVVLVLSCLPWSPVYYVYQLAPMIFVLLISMTKSGVEDLIKHAEDNRRNRAPTLAFRDGEWITLPAADLRVGDVIRITEDSMVCADILFVGSDHPDGRCYYSEANLNGETAIKTIQAHPAFDPRRSVEQISDAAYSIDLSAPDRDLTRFDARLRLGPDFWPIAIQSVLLRGASTHFTENLIGIVLRTGHDTKIMLNMHQAPSKLTQFDHSLNRALIEIFIFKITLVVLSAALGAGRDRGTQFRVIRPLYPGSRTSFLEFFAAYFILYSYLFPISMTVTIEIVRLFHSVLIYNDPEMVDPEFGHAASRNSNVGYQLGNISHILSDKTGTLTENVMDMKKIAVHDAILDASEIGRQHGDILLAMAVCNNVIVIDNDYKAESADELAFVTFAGRCGVNLVRRTQTEIAVDFFGSLCTFELLAMLPFDTERKRQSVILRREDGVVILFCKGADSVISARSTHFEFDRQISELASQGLRTLVFTSKEVLAEELDNWLDGHRAAEASICDRDLLIAQSANAIETGLVPIGVTGLEDKLQAEVPETISWIKEAGIQLWVLTGDKLETAISIGRTSGVVLSESSILTVSNSEQNFSEFLERKEEYYRPVLIVVGEAVEDRWNEFLEVAAFCCAVILARASPFVKAHVAQLLRDSGHRVMAVGDGANDVCMLQTAHVGVGIYGREGSQAALSADFALPRFRFLRRLLMVHGHWPFRRLGIVAVYMLYKNVVFIFGQLWFAFETLWSPTAYYEPFLMTCFNLLFTCVPPVIFGLWEEDLPQEVLLASPQLYFPEYDPLANERLCLTIGIGIYQSAAAFFGVRLSMPRGSLVENGTLTFLVVVAIVETQIIMWHSSLNVWCAILYVWQTVVVFVIIIIYCKAGDWELMPVLTHSLRTAVIWFGCAVTVGLALVPVWIGEAVVRRFWPSAVYQFAEAVHEEGHRKGGELDSLAEETSETHRQTLFARLMET